MMEDKEIYTANLCTVPTIGSFRNGNADVRLCVSCANFGSWHSYELETMRPLESSTVIAEIKVVLEVRRSWRINQSETFPGEGIRSCITCTRQYTAELRRSFAKALVRHNGPKNAVPSRLVASCVAQFAASPCESSLMAFTVWRTGFLLSVLQHDCLNCGNCIYMIT